MTESGQSKEAASLDEKVESPSKQMGSTTTAPAKSSRGWGRRIGRFLLICLYIGFLTAVVLAALAGIEYYAYLRIKASPLGEAYKNRDMDLARQSSQKVAPQFGYEPTPGFAAVRNTRLGNSYRSTSTKRASRTSKTCLRTSPRTNIESWLQAVRLFTAVGRYRLRTLWQTTTR